MTAPTRPVAPPSGDLLPLALDLPPVVRRSVMPGGFVAGGRPVGIKASGRPDLALIRTVGDPAAAAAVFTTNALPAAPVLLSRTNLAASLRADASADAPVDTSGPGTTTDLHIRPGSPDDPDAGRYGWAEAIVATSGCANAATGLAGLSDQVAVALAAATRLGVDPLRVLCLSTGVIGSRLPVDAIRAGIEALAGDLGTSTEALEAAADALRTTDGRTKSAAAVLSLPGPDGSPVRVTVAGIAKGVGMIHPRMATMLSVLLTDARVEPLVLSRMLRPIVARTWNQLSVDGDTSTNDTVLLLASGASGAAPTAEGSSGAAALASALEAVARDLARQQAADGEGATTLMTCQVSGAADDEEARAIARAVVASSLVKAAVHGRDANWGRIAAAAGNARLPDVELLELAGRSQAEARARAGRQARLDGERLRIAIAGIGVFDGAAGGPLAFDPDAVRRAMDAEEVLIRLDLGLGVGSGEAFGCDLTEEYVVANAEYTT